MMANMDILTTERFEDLAMAYGGTLARWPDTERARAEAFCAAHPEGEAILAEARMLDAALDGLDVPAPSEALMTRILGDAADVAAERAAEAPRPAVRRAPKPRFSFGFGRISRWAPGMALAASLALGVGVGASGAVETTPADAVLAIVAPDTATDAEGGMSLVLVSDDASEDDLFLGSGAFL